jgi:hypothetical protein
MASLDSTQKAGSTLPALPPPTPSASAYALERNKMDKLPLELFDDADEFETRTPQEWVGLGPAQGVPHSTGRSLFYLHQQLLWFVLTFSGGHVQCLDSSVTPLCSTIFFFFFFFFLYWIRLPCDILSYDETTHEYEVCFLSEDEIRARPALQSVLIELLNSLGDLANPKPTVAKGIFPLAFAVTFLRFLVAHVFITTFH